MLSLIFNVRFNKKRTLKIKKYFKVIQKIPFKCQNHTISIVDASTDYLNPTIFYRNNIIQLLGLTKLNCLYSLANQKQWTIFQVSKLTGIILQQLMINNNPTVNYAELVFQPQTLYYGLYKVVFTVTMTNTNFGSSVVTFIQINPSGLVLSSLKSSQPMYGGMIQITRGEIQPIQFDPYLLTYDIDNLAVITSLSFKYACQIIQSDIPQGYPEISGKNQMTYLDDLKYNSSLGLFNTCFNSTSKIENFCNSKLILPVQEK